MWLTRDERIILAVLGVIALVGLGVLLWQQQRPPLVVEGEPIQTAQWNEALAAARQVDINTASAAQLERLPEIGPGLAARIVAYRKQHGRFHNTEELMQVRGIGPKKYQALKDSLVVY